MKLHHLKPAEGSRKTKIRVGRGDRGRRGAKAGRGTKGTGAHGTVPAGFEGGQMPLKRRQPKLAGFKRYNPEPGYSVINVSRLDDAFEAGDQVTADSLYARGLVKKGRKVKVLGHGDLSKALTVDVDAVSGTARDKITAAGGTVSGGEQG
jgi:large subunit ribosomal protein L15